MTIRSITQVTPAKTKKKKYLKWKWWWYTIILGRNETWVNHYRKNMRTGQKRSPSSKRRIRISPTKAIKIWEAQRGLCKYCFKKLKPEEVTFDHVIPASKGGKENIDNLVIACFHCNCHKGDKISYTPKNTPGWKRGQDMGERR